MKPHVIWTLLGILCCASGILYVVNHSTNANRLHTQKVTIGYQPPTAQTWGAVILKHFSLVEEEFQKLSSGEQLEVDWVASESGPPLNNGMMAGKINLAFMGDMPLLSNGFAASRSRVYQSALLAMDGHGIDGQNQAIVAMASSGMKNLRDLVGKRLAVPFGTSAHRLALVLLKEAGIEQQVDLFNTTIPVGMSMLRAAKVDAVAAWEPHVANAVENNDIRVLADGSISKQEYVNGVVADVRWAKNNPIILQAVLNALNKAHLKLQDNRARNRAEMSEAIAFETKYSVEVVSQVTRRILFSSSIDQNSVKALVESYDFLLQENKISEFNVMNFLNHSELNLIIKR